MLLFFCNYRCIVQIWAIFAWSHLMLTHRLHVCLHLEQWRKEESSPFLGVDKTNTQRTSRVDMKIALRQQMGSVSSVSPRRSWKNKHPRQAGGSRISAVRSNRKLSVPLNWEEEQCVLFCPLFCSSAETDALPCPFSASTLSFVFTSICLLVVQSFLSASSEPELHAFLSHRREPLETLLGGWCFCERERVTSHAGRTQHQAQLTISRIMNKVGGGGVRVCGT